MNGLWIEIALVFVLIGINAVLAGSEIAFVTLREGQIDRLAERGRRGVAAATLAQDPNRLLATVQIGITLAGFFASATAAVSIAELLVEPLGFLGNAAEPVAIAAVTLILSYLSLVFGELAPKRIALQRAESWVTRLARPLAAASFVTRPVVWLLSKSTDAIVRLFGGDPAVKREEFSKEELREIVASRSGWHRLERRIVSGAFEIAERRLKTIAVPRPSIVYVQANDPTDKAIEILLSSGLSRAPVTRDDIDDIVGVVHLRDLIDQEGTVGDHARSVLTLPETLTLTKALAEMQQARTQLAVVIDEYGGTEGIVSLEDILEEVVGEIYDEFDRDIKQIRRLPNGSLIVRGDFPIHDLRDINVHLPEGDYTTLAGLVIDRLGTVPDAGQELTVSDWTIEVLQAGHNKVNRLKLSPRPKDKTSEDMGEAGNPAES